MLNVNVLSVKFSPLCADFMHCNQHVMNHLTHVYMPVVQKVVLLFSTGIRTALERYDRKAEQCGTQGYCTIKYFNLYWLEK